MEKAAAQARLEARVTQEFYDLVKRAASLSHQSITDFTVAAVQQAAMSTIERVEQVRLCMADQERFAQALLAPPEPAPALARAFKRRKQMLEDA
ncbi:MAG: DUF1778 domain-containing protein [Burkholderiaceae bacterium]|nr:DUF1778 domain-containing protein [Burkholderiaceae bacterium]